MKLHSLFSVVFLLFSLLGYAEPPKWAYDKGPNPDTEQGKAMLEVLGSVPPMAELSFQLTDRQKYRKDFGPEFWRKTSDNPVQIWFRGQDATHIAEAANRTATAAFGGRAQDLARHLGVNETSAYSNAYPTTIFGQYGSFKSPIIHMKNGKPTVRFEQFVDNHLWTMTHEGPLADWNQKFTETMIKQNPEMKLIVLFGGASQDTAGTFVNNLKPGTIPSVYSDEDMKDIRVAEMKLVGAGGNNEFAVPVDAMGEDLYAKKLGRKVNYKDEEEQNLAMKAMTDDPEWFADRMVFSKGGPHKNGILHPAQIGGYVLKEKTGEKKDKIIKGKNGKPDKVVKEDVLKAVSLKGLKLSDGTVLGDILLAELPHPSSLSRMKPAEASLRVEEGLELFAPYKAAGWKIKADPGQVNHYENGDKYDYGRADIGPEFYDFGTPKNRMVSVSSAYRMQGKSWGIVFGTRDSGAEFDEDQLQASREAEPEKRDKSTNMTGHGNFGEGFDRGPGQEWAKIMKENLDLKAIFKPKKDADGKNMSFYEMVMKNGKLVVAEDARKNPIIKDGIKAYNVKSNEDVGDFGHFRGTFDKPQVLILADPTGYDDVGTSRALTGARGQYLHGIMQDVGVKEKYLVIKTVPFAMDGATPKEWETVLKQTNAYREKIIQALKAKGMLPPVIVADGPNAKAELERILKAEIASGKVKIVALERGDKDDNDIQAGGKKIAKALGSDANITGKMRDIPRTHLPYLAHYWEGRGGDHVFTATDNHAGEAFGVVVPKYATDQVEKREVKVDSKTQKMLDQQIKRLRDAGLRLPGESVEDFVARRELPVQEPALQDRTTQETTTVPPTH